MSVKRRYIIVGTIIVLILAVAFWWKHQSEAQARVQDRLLLAITHVSDTAKVIRRALAPEFTVSQEQTTQAGCEEKSPDISLTRLYDCNVTAKMELSSVQTISASHAQDAIKAALSRLGVASADLGDVDSYGQNISETGSWAMAQPVNIPHTAIAGVPPFNYFGGIGQEDIGVQLSSDIDPANSKKIVLSVTIAQEYQTCKSFFLPCMDVLMH
jgi:hypothetical protein